MIASVFSTYIYIWIGIALFLFPIQLLVTAPYGRHTSESWGILIDNKLGWILMEIISPITFAYFFLTGSVEKTNPMCLFFTLWILHYLHRSVIFPFFTRTKGKQIPLLIALFAICFNLINGFTNGYWLGSLSQPYPEEWFFDIRFLLGFLLFVVGAGINIYSDYSLIKLRKPGETGYKIPRGGLFEYISCPNHFGEIIEWTGFAVMCWNLPALAFAIWTVANLSPRAWSHHKWYKKQFKDYPKGRKAVIPGLW